MCRPPGTELVGGVVFVGAIELQSAGSGGCGTARAGSVDDDAGVAVGVAADRVAYLPHAVDALRDLAAHRRRHPTEPTMPMTRIVNGMATKNHGTWSHTTARKAATSTMASVASMASNSDWRIRRRPLSAERARWYAPARRRWC